MRRSIGMAVAMAAMVCWARVGAMAQDALTVTYLRDGESTQVRLADYAQVSGSVAYQGPVMDGSENWKSVHTYTGVSLRAVVDALGGLAAEDTLSVVAIDGWYKTLPSSVVDESSPAGPAILATAVDDEADWENAPMLVFLPEDEGFSNDDMLSAFGPELSHYFGESPSTTGMMVKAVSYLVVNYDGAPLPLPFPLSEPAVETSEGPDVVLLTVERGETRTGYTRSDLQTLDVITAPGTFTNSAGVDYTATYTGVPLMTLVGNIPLDSTIRVSASDGYSMNYAAEMIADATEGTWVVAFEENGEPMPFDPGPLRIVQVGEDNPHFTSSLSAKMVSTIEVLGTYEEYSLLLTGAAERVFARGELEAGIGCPCHTANVTVTSKGETHTYAGLPLWRLVAYVDDGIFPALEDGIHYNDEDFNDALAATEYTIVLTASDGYTQSVPANQIAWDDRFVVAFKMDGVFLDPASSGYMRFVYDDSVELPEGMRLRSVKFLESITLEL